MSVSAFAAQNFANHLTPFETVFVHAVLEHRGVYEHPSFEDFRAALDVLRQFDALCIANPGWDSVYAPRADSDDLPALRAKAFLMFGTISPTPAQWHKAHVALSAGVVRDLRLAQRIRRGRLHNVLDQTGSESGEIAIYTLSDPRDIEVVRYVGQTRNPVSRFSQHMNAARLWLPDVLPWWVRREEWRPLYTWIRQLYREDGRLPLMVVVGWTIAELANSDERRFVRAFVADKLPLLNVCLNPLE